MSRPRLAPLLPVSWYTARMWVIVHALSGMALGSLLATRSLWEIAFWALALHVVLDLIPHWDYTRLPRRVRWGTVDAGLSIVSLVLARAVFCLDWGIVVAGIVSALPDLELLDTLFGLRRRRLFPSHRPWFPHGSCGPLPGVMVQATIVIASLLLLVLV